ncbi:MAG: arginine--tRNA ligase [Thermodesulfatator sp.]|nr:MAG: arginine--tRNA ligase [Thermodesulfatator sp.]
MRRRIKEIVEDVYLKLAAQGNFPRTEIPEDHIISVPKQEQHGDYASNFCLVMASHLKMAPRKIAEKLQPELEQEGLFERVEVAGPGFLNFFLSADFWQDNLLEIRKKGHEYGRSNSGKGKKVLVEFVSANPTGPLHVGHGRGAAVGDSLCRVLKMAGYDVSSEYYINDVGNQMQTLGKSVYLRYQEYFGRKIDFPRECYQGDYIKDIAARIAREEGEKFLDSDISSHMDFFIERAVSEIFTGIKKDLEDFRVHFDSWFSERTLHDSGLVERTIEELKDRGRIYEKDGALWFRTSDFGDEKDRVVKRSNGVLTYFAADIAYHRNKFERGFERLVDIWGADHHGYIPRVKAAIAAMDFDPEALDVLLVQLVNLIEGGEIKAMSTRAGEFITLREVIDDVGTDAARFIFLTRRCDSHLDFDLDLAKSQSQENPVYYVQYAHARLASVFRTAEEKGVAVREPGEVDLSRLSDPEEMKIMKLLAFFPDTVSQSARSLEPHRISYYLTELAGLLHKYYTTHRFIGDDPEITQARLLLAGVVKTVLKNGLNLLGVNAPDRM